MRQMFAAACLALGLGGPALSQSNSVDPGAQALQRASDSVVGLKAMAVDDARSSATLGTRRQGSGVLIGKDGMVLTIGYLVLEAEDVTLQTDDGRQWPARVVAYDVATGFGLVQSLVPLPLEPAPLGESGSIVDNEPLMITSGGDSGAVSMARLLSRRSFSGNWEYHLDEALFTAPPRRDQSGAGLFNGKGELVGIGSLWLADATSGQGPRQGGNMFVPIDLLKPIMGELRSRGSSQASARAWMGVQAAETAAGIRITRVNPDSPADVAGLEDGDLIERIDGTAVKRLESLWKTLWAGGPPEREVRLDILREGRPLSVNLVSVDRMKTMRRAKGV